jgi:hypothetical protein
VPIVPDDKDSTWVLERPGPACGFAAAMVPTDSVAALLRANAAAWESVARFSIAGFSRSLLHDPVHHLYDVTGRRGNPHIGAPQSGSRRADSGSR